METKKLINNFVFVFIAGGSCSGKSILADAIKDYFIDTSIIRQDWYYKNIQFQEDDTLERFESFDLDLLFDNIRKIINNEKVLLPTYSYKLHRRINLKRSLDKRSRVIVIEGLYAIKISKILKDKKWFNNIPYLNIYLDVQEKTMIERRVKRDLIRTNQGENDIILQMNNYVLPTFRRYIKCQKKDAKIVLENNSNINFQYNRSFLDIIAFMHKVLYPG